ncbi:stigma-specific STIG1-like protein 2 [Salvia miltiorrhiza]|uniref:stigma-specific STIG1-like protein 2 n=1 Tax=Salvia miltiorrhiza TaxID=226208 RepID=UPI0025AD77FD|nr:stigma-specific STIG1-like protein 2 [Salvia miltiorrhiza]
MKVIKVIFSLIAFVVAVTLILTANDTGPTPSPPPPSPLSKPAATTRVSRFLQEKGKNPRAADHCHKDNDVCNNTLEDGRNATCCNNKCLDLQYDDKNCGACKKKCAFTETCCRGECVMLAYDKRHCGTCNKKCAKFCLYGMCSYA